MSLQLAVKTLDGLSPEIAGLYQPFEEGFRLDVENHDADALAKALRSERQVRKEVQREASVATRSAEEAASALRDAHAERDRALVATEKMRASIFATLVRAQATAAGLHTAAIPDAIRAVREIFVVGDEGSIVPKDEASKITLEQFFAASRDESPHWHPASASGTGAQPSQSGGAVGHTMTRQAFDQLRPSQRAAVMRDGVTRLVD